MDAAADDVDQRFRQPLKRHMHRLDTGFGYEFFAGQMHGGAGARRAEQQLARIRAAMRDEITQGFDAERRRHHQRIGAVADVGDAGQIPHGVERKLGLHRHMDGNARGRGQQRVTVGRGLGHEVRRNRAAGAGTVFNDDRLAPVLAHLLADDARQRVGRAAGGEGDDDAYGFGGEFLLCGGWG